MLVLDNKFVFFFNVLNMSSHSLLSLHVPVQKFTDSFMGTPLNVTSYFSLATFNILSLSLTFDNFVIKSVGVALVRFNLLGPLGCKYMDVPFSPQILEFSIIVVLNRLCVLSFPFSF